jgi:hypothetical protein
MYNFEACVRALTSTEIQLAKQSAPDGAAQAAVLSNSVRRFI